MTVMTHDLHIILISTLPVYAYKYPTEIIIIKDPQVLSDSYGFSKDPRENPYHNY